jgi:glutathione S-transferase
VKLCYTLASPFARKVRVTAAELGLAGRVELVLVSTSPTEPDRGLTDANPLGKIPVLLTDEGHWIYDSRVICEYLNALAGASLLPSGGAARWRVLRLQALADGIADAGVLTVYEARRPPQYQWPDWRQGQLKKVTAGLDALEAASPELEGDVNLGQISVACALSWLAFRSVVPELSARWPGLSRWHRQFAQRPSMAATAPGPV